MSHLRNVSNRYTAVLNKISAEEIEDSKKFEDTVNELDEDLDSEATLN